MCHIYVVTIECKGLAHSHPSSCQQSDQGLEGQHAIAFSQARRGGDQRSHFIIRVKVRSSATSLPRQQIGWRHFGRRIDCVQVRSEATHNRKPFCQPVSMSVNRQSRPGEHRGDAQMLFSAFFSVTDELHEQSLSSTQLESERTADSEVIEESLS